MIIGVGSTSKAKLDAVRSLVPRYGFLRQAEVVGVEAPSGVSNQPMSLSETMQGAMNRAKVAYANRDLGFGIESGLIQVPHTKTGMMDVCACAIYDGREFHCGLSSAFEVPHKVMELIKSEKLELNDAFVKAKLPTNPEISGVIESLTNGRVSRAEFTRQSIMMALVHLEYPSLYGKEERAANSKVICSICSRAKDEREELMPARWRYAGTHVAKVSHHAKSLHLPFYILSGVYGFISGEKQIPYYDHPLKPDEVPALVEVIVGQLAPLEVKEIVFCTKDKPNWKPYLNAIKQATDRLKIRLSVHELADDD